MDTRPSCGRNRASPGGTRPGGSGDVAPASIGVTRDDVAADASPRVAGDNCSAPYDDIADYDHTDVGHHYADRHDAVLQQQELDLLARLNEPERYGVALLVIGDLPGAPGAS